MFAGFGTLLILTAIISIDSLYNVEKFENHNTQIRQGLLDRERTLQQTQASVYESGDIIDGYLVATDPRAEEKLRSEFQSIQSEATDGLRDCIQTLPADRKEPFQKLAAELDRYWATVDPVFSLRGPEKKGRGNSAVPSDAAARYTEVLAIAKEVSALNSDELKETDRRIADSFAQFRSRLVMFPTMAFGFGLILAAGTIVYAGRLERSVQEKYEESLRAQQELRELSKRLVEAEERERRAISRELHDEVGQSLNALLLDVEALTEMSSADGAFRQGLQKIKTLAETCVNEVRNMSLLLRPSMLDDLGLAAAIDWQGREVSKRTGMIVDTSEENVSDDLPEDHKICVYRIVQEALNNCSKHAHAKNVRVMVRQEPNRLLVSVEDDGKGFDPTRVRGLGLMGMNERVSQLGGVLKVESDPTAGTRLRIDLPLPNTSPGELNA